MKTATAPDYLNPIIPHGLPTHQMPLVKATSETLQDYGTVVNNHPESFEIEIVRWPAQGWRPVDEDSGNEGGVTKGIFSSAWRGEVLYGHNAAVNGHTSWATATFRNSPAKTLQAIHPGYCYGMPTIIQMEANYFFHCNSNHLWFRWPNQGMM